MPLNKLQSILDSKKITQKALAGELHVTKSTVNGYCKGNSDPGYEILFHICKFLNVSVEELFGLSEKTYVMSKEDMDLITHYQGEINKILEKYNRK